MKSISISDFKNNADAIIRQVEQGEAVLLTRDGAPTVRLENVQAAGAGLSNGDVTPVIANSTSLGDLHRDLAAEWTGGPDETPLNNSDIDRIVYGR